MNIASLSTAILTNLPIAPDQVQLYFTLGFFVIVLFLVLGFLIGLWRGIWNASFRLIFVGGLVIVAFLFTRNIADALSNIDIKAFLANFGVNLTTIDVPLGEDTIVVEVTSAREMVLSLISQAYEAFGLGSADSAAASELILALALVFIRYIIFIVEALLIVFVIDPLSGLLYHLIFKWFIPKPVRKHMKKRLIGGFENMVKVGLVTTMMMIPFTSLLNTINQAVRDRDTVRVEGNSETYDTMMSFLDAYNNSAFAQILFNWSVNEDGKTLDVVLMDFVTQENMDDATLALSTEMYTVAQIGTTLISSGIIEDAQVALSTQILTNEDLVSSLFLSLANSALIVKAIPIALAVAMNVPEVQEYVDPTLLDFDGVDWREELLNLSTITNQVVASGVVTSILNAGDDPNAVPVAALRSLTAATAHDDVKAALTAIDDSEFLSQVIPAVLYTMVQSEIATPLPEGSLGLSTFLPTDWADYEDFHFGEELGLVYDTFYNLMNVTPDFTDMVIDTLFTQTEEPSPAIRTTKNAQSNSDPYSYGGGGLVRDPSYILGVWTKDDLIAEIRDNIDPILALIVGATDDDGDPLNVDAEGKTDLTVAGAKPCILDSDLLMQGMRGILDYGLTQLGSMDALTSMGFALDETKKDEVLTDLEGTTSGERRVNFKREYGSVLGIVGALIGNDKLVEALGLTSSESSSSEQSSAAVQADNPETEPGAKTPLRSSVDSSSSSSSEDNAVLDLFQDEEVREYIKDEVCPRLDNSHLMGFLLPDILEAVVGGTDFTEIRDFIGLDVTDLNFDLDSIGTEMGVFIDLMGYALNVMDADMNDIETFIGEHAGDITGILDCIYQSNIFNPKDALGNFESENYYTILETIFTGSGDFGFDPDEVSAAVRSVDETGWATTYDEEGNVVQYGENYYMIHTISTVFDEGLFDLMGETNILTALNSPEYDGAITAVFSSIEDSEVMSSCFGGLLDNLFSGDTTIVDPDGLGTSFRNVTDWAAEGANLELMLDTLNTFGNDLEGIDFMDFSAENVESLLTELAHSGIFDDPDGDYLLGEFLYSKFIGAGMGEYLLDKDEVSTDPSPYDEVHSDFLTVGPTTSEADKLAWEQEISAIANVIGAVNDLETALGSTDGLGALTNGSASAAQIETVVLAVNDCSVLRMAIYNVFDDMLGGGSMNMGSLNPSDANTAILIDCTKAERATEIGYTLDIYDAVQTLALDTGFSEANLNADTIETMLTNLHNSKLFNTINEDHSRLAGDLTVFEQTIKMIEQTATLDDYVYKQSAEVLRDGLLEDDILLIGNNLAGTTLDVDGWLGVGGEIAKLGDLMQAFKDTALTFTSFGTDGANAVSTLMDTPEGIIKVQNLLLAVNHSELMYPAIPNLFDTMLTATDVGITGVDLSAANTHYVGDRGEGAYPDSEITSITDLFSQMKDLASTSYNDLSALTTDTLDDIEDLLTSLAESEIFHQQGASSGVNSDPTVFEQLMVKIMDDTGISGQINDTNNPNPLYYDGLVYKFASAHEKALYLVVNFETINDSGDLFTTSWTGTGGEIEAFIRIFREIKRSMPSMTTATIDPTAINPTNVSDILAALNYSNLGSDAVPKVIKDSFTDISINTFTGGNEEYYLTPMEYADTELDDKDYSTLIPTTTSTGLFHILLNAFWDETLDPDGYIDMSGGFSLANYVNGGHSTSNILQFLEGSKIFGPTVPGKTYKVRSLVFYNWLDQIEMEKYIRTLANGSMTADERCTKLENVFAGDFDYVMESGSLDGLVVNLNGFTGAVNAGSLEGFGQQASAMISSTYAVDGSNNIVDRAYLSSELVAGFYTDILASEYALAGRTGFEIDFFASDFAELNPTEALGVNGALEVVPEINAIVSGGTTQAEVDALRASFVDMGSYVACHTPGPAWNNGNSHIAQLIYAARVVTNANFVGAKAAYEFLNPGQTIEDDPYVSGFVFETEGGKICDYYETLI